MINSYWIPSSAQIVRGSERVIQTITAIELPTNQSPIEDADEYLGCLGLRIKAMISHMDIQQAINMISSSLPAKILEELPLEQLLYYHSTQRDISLTTALAEGLTLANWGLIELLEESLIFEFPLPSLVADAASLAQQIVKKSQLSHWLEAINLAYREISSFV
ncbi:MULTISPECIES: hypothetical protein [unclassified Coleofasciculus]|uniref:hypothetical protein n=1 Tax=unclassified Coleofasciculus TaxID=2692782 RepID=UPI0018824D8F|nr:MULTISPECIES: hypothetical protein [unclassified Coleofasciculus]MBE9124773.1 hypothetical protein [Coleofasciculus sp. LEGE 07081]MBE9148225.1 hypothetical protein [Coleofasciculus sp. LEGE 07092]